MPTSPLAGKPAPKELLVDLTKLERAYYERRPDLADPTQLVSFGTSGHRGSPLNGSFTEAHILAVMQNLLRQRTVLIIAHRQLTAQSADQVVVVDHGRVLESGPPAILSQQNGAYHRLITGQGACL